MSIKTGANDFVGRTSTQLQFTFLGVNVSTKKVGMYSVFIPTKDPVTGALIGNWLKSDYAIGYGKDVTGAVTGTVTLDQADPTGDMSLTWKEDFNFVQDNSIGYNRNILRGLLSGQTVSFANGDRVAMLGVAGNYKTDQKATKDQLNKEWGNLLKPYWGFLLVDGAFEDETGEPKKNVNGLINASLTLVKPFMVENYTLSGSGKANCRMMPAVSTKTMTLDEGDYNMCSVTLQVLCDSYEQDDFFNVGFDSADYSTGELSRLSVDYIVEGSSGDIASPVTDDVACVVVAETGAITIEKYNGATWDVETGGTFEDNAIIFSKKHVISTVETEGNAFVSVKTAGTGLDGFASSFVLDKDDTVTNYVCVVYAYERNSQNMENLVVG